MPDSLRVACVQLNNGPDRAANMGPAIGYIREAARQGAKLICTPEYTCQMIEPGKTSRLTGAQTEQNNDQLKQYRALARELGVWLLIGSLGVKVSDDKIANRSFLINDKGDVAAKYDKTHLADLNLADGRYLRESAIVQPGDKVVVAKTPWGGLGMSICYDVRFPLLYNTMAKAGAVIMTTPAAYSMASGTETWEIFQRTRAAETNSFVLAPGQCGLHEGTRHTWGHSLILAPDGRILAQGSADKPGIIVADLDLSEVALRRRMTPTQHQQRNDLKVETQVGPQEIATALPAAAPPPVPVPKAS